MSAENTIIHLENYCRNSTKHDNQWHGNSAIYKWTKGKTDPNGTVNGVVRKLAGISVTGEQIWVVAGSFKIGADGSIVRFTGLPKSVQTLIQNVSAIVQKNTSLETV